VSLFIWIALGLVAGFITSKLVNRTDQGLVFDVALGVVGAVLGGWLFGGLGTVEVGGLNLYSLLVAVVGAAVLLAVYHAVYRQAT